MRNEEAGPVGPRPSRRTARTPRSAGSPVLLALLLLAGLAGLAFLQARLLAPLLLARGRTESPEIREVNLPERRIRVLVAEGTPSLLLKTPLDLPEANEAEAERLDRALFPDGGRHTYWLLVARNDSEEAVRLPLPPGAVRVLDKSGEERAAVDLARVVAGRSAELPPSLRVWLRLLLPPDGEVVIRPGGSRQILVAIPGTGEAAELVSARIGELSLDGRVLTKDELDRLLDRREDDGESEKS